MRGTDTSTPINPEQPNPNNDQDKSSSSPDEPKPELASIWQVFSFCPTASCRNKMIGAIVCAVISGVVMPAMIFYMSEAMENLAASTENTDFMTTLREVAFSLMILGVIIFCSMTAQSMLMETAASEMTQHLKITWFRALLRQDMAYYDIQDVAGQATILSTNGAKYRKGVGRKLSEAIQFIVTFCGALGYSFYASWKTSLAVLAVAPFMFLSVLFLVKMNTTQSARANATYAKAGSIVSTAVSSIRTILSLNAVPRMIALYRNATQEAYQGAVGSVWLVGLANGCQNGSFMLSYIVVALFGGWLLYDNVRDSGCDPSNTVPDNPSTCDPSGADIFGALMGITFGAAVLPQVSVAIEAMSGARAACAPALAAMSRTVERDAEHHIEAEERSNSNDVTSAVAIRRGATVPLPKYVIDSSSDSGKKPDTVIGDICFENVTFAYPTRQENKVFNRLSLQIKPGTTVAIVGASGEGKSTAVQLIERFYDPQEGSISLDSTDLRELNVKWLRQQIGLVSQEPKLFAKSIRENIALGCPDASQEQIEEAARLANAHDFIMTFPNKYDTQVGDLGSQLSGGQKQRIAIARVLVKKVKILLLDEATSALDSESERVVQQALDRLMELSNMTTVVIAHRLSTIKNADMIVVLNGGHVVETGTHEELLQKEEHYYRLVQAQTLETGEASKSISEHGTSRESRRSSSFADLTEHGTNTSAESSIHNGSDQPVVHFRDVHFHYPSRSDIQVFRGIHLSVHQGETLAIVGPSGQGKSTIVQMIERFYDPDSGVIEFFGTDLKALSVRWLRDQMGLVSQEPVLFDTSIEENIRYGLESATQQDVESAARMANAHDFIMSFPEGYKTSVGQGSTLISGGQKQRIALARALLKKPKLLLLDEATSALDSESEKVVQATLDEIMFGRDQTCVVIAHRLSTIRNADRIALIDRGKVRELGTHDELMAKGGKYAKLVSLQSLQAREEKEEDSVNDKHEEKDDDKAGAQQDEKEDAAKKEEEEDIEIDKEEEKSHAKRVRMLASGDQYYILVGGIGALMAGLVFPASGFVFAYMIEMLFTPVFFCDDDNPLEPFPDCDAYWRTEASRMQDLSIDIFYGLIGVIFAAVFGNMWLFWGFGVATERMNKRVRDSAFASLLRQEIAWFDLRSPGAISSQLADDAALLQAFAGEPVRTLILNVASVLVGLAVSFYFMWPFALLTLGILPFMAFGAEMEMKMYTGEDEGDANGEQDESSPGGLAIETLSNIRTVASLTLEEERVAEYQHALAEEEVNPMLHNFFKGSASGIGQFMQLWGMALMFWWGGWLLFKFPHQYSYRDYLISMWALFVSLYGLAIAAQGAVNREKAKLAAHRIFELVDRESLIDPLSDNDEQEKGFLEASC